MVENSACAKSYPAPAGRNVAVKPCDHGQNKHDRVWMCEVCEQSPACVTCKADAAALCVTCDRDIHSANPLARRHDRIPLVPFYDSAGTVVKSTAGNMDPVSDYGNTVKEDDDSLEIPRNATKFVDLLSAGDRLFNFGFQIPTDVRIESQFHDSVNDGVVPIQSTVPITNSSAAPIADQKSNARCYEIDFNRCVNTQSQSHSVSYSSVDAGVVLEENSLLDVSNPFMLPVNGGGICNQKAKQLSAADREARVLRYREKRKNRKFEKKIRYASRKAYAEMRPRIKGRFVKRTELMTVLDVDRWWFTAESNANSYGAGEQYGVVPSF